MGRLVTTLLLLSMTLSAAPPTGELTFDLIPNSVHPGDEVKAKGSGFDSCFPKPTPTPAPSPTPTPTSRVIIRADVRPLNPAWVSGEPPPVTVTVHWVERDGSSGTVLAVTQLDASAGFETAFTVPSALRPGQYEVAAECGNPNGGTGVPGEIATAFLTVTAAPVSPSPKPTPPERTNEPPPTSSPENPSQQPPPASVPDRTFPTAEPPVSPAPAPYQPRSNPLRWLVMIGVVAALVALAELGRRIVRARRQPTRSPRLPVVHAVAGTSVSGPVELRQIGPGRTVAVRVAPRAGTGVVAVRRISEARYE